MGLTWMGSSMFIMPMQRRGDYRDRVAVVAAEPRRTLNAREPAQAFRIFLGHHGHGQSSASLGSRQTMQPSGEASA